MPVRRVPEVAAPLRARPRGTPRRPGARRARPRATRAGTSGRAPCRARPARCGRRAASTSWNVRSSARKSGIPSPLSASITAASDTSAKWWPLATICVPTSTARSAAAKRRSVVGQLAALLDRVGIEPEALELGNVRFELALEALRACADPRELDRPAGRAGLRRGLRVARSGDSGAPRRGAARARRRSSGSACVSPQARQCSAGRDSAAVEQQDRLAALLGDLPQLREERRRQRIAGLAAQVDDAHRRASHADPLAELEVLEGLPALRAGRRAAVDRDRSLERRPLGRDRPRVVARVGLLLVGRVVLLVDADQAEPGQRREDRGARADHDRRLAGGDPLALVTALCVGQRRVQDRHPVAEPRAKAAHGLRRERDLGDEDDHAEPAAQRLAGRLEVDLGLPAPGGAVEQEMASFVEGAPQRSSARSCVSVSALGSASPGRESRSAGCGSSLRRSRFGGATSARARPGVEP